jgi:alpha-glucosidase
MSLVGEIPTTWDETIVLDAKLGEYIVTARRKNTTWYIGGMSNWSGKTIDLDLSFIPQGTYDVTLATDGVSADRYPSDYTISHKPIDRKTKITMAKGGGFVMVLKEKKN